ncbi:AAA family ATPase [Myroides sp. 1354]|uniref:AAA family ATPase n=1 Tax=unclassified Myroides TaxID=2642485 RepID=UPI002575307B|nr:MULTISPECIES: AAA family ATPase [unclassified Myroides]MDM1045909.1 AAA family ATPase [Myroides sp. R163-1]MDM1056919.1 AAA family ATPase [Myroides sp. 1354]MDM1070114.1 AAA family ATPase [Myroides sp. 1372]
MITINQKQQITIALNDYITKHNISANEIVKRSGINESYLSSIRNGDTMVGKSEIKDKWYLMLAEFIDFKLVKEYWTMQETPQLFRMLSTLEDAKEGGLTNIVIGETGSGKSYISDLFVKANPIDTFKIVVGSLDTIGDLLDKVIDALKIATPKTKSKKIGEIAKKLRQLRLEGLKPHLIFDECEYMKQPALCAMKELYDALIKICGITLIGTSQLIDNLDKLRKKNRSGIPQFYRRIKFGIRELPTIDRSFELFLKNVEDTSLRKFLKQNCDNYGELHDVLVPAMKEADRTGKELTEEFVRTILGMPKMIA